MAYHKVMSSSQIRFNFSQLVFYIFPIGRMAILSPTKNIEMNILRTQIMMRSSSAAVQHRR